MSSSHGETVSYKTCWIIFGEYLLAGSVSISFLLDLCIVSLTRFRVSYRCV